MAVRLNRDDPTKNPTKLFIKDSFARAKDIAFNGIVTERDKNTCSPAMLKTARGVSFTMISSMTALLFTAGSTTYDAINYSHELEETLPTNIEAIENASIENGIAATQDHIAIRIGDEFMIYTAPESNKSNIYTYVSDPTEALTIASKYQQQYEMFADIQGIEDSYNLDVVTDNNVHSIDIGQISTPYQQGDAIHIRIDGKFASETGMFVNGLLGQAENWSQIVTSISDGGYDQVILSANYPEHDSSLSGFDSLEAYMIVHMLQGYALFAGLSLAGGFAGTAFQRQKQKSKRRNNQHKPK
jgi:hypothetical protein